MGVLGRPETRYLSVEGGAIAWQMFGEPRPGIPDVVMCQGSVSNLDVFWENPDVARFYSDIAAHTRLIMFDRRGVGASERVAPEELQSYDEWADDFERVLDAAGARRAVAVGVMDAGPVVIRLAARGDGRVVGIVLVRTAAKLICDESYPHGVTGEEFRASTEERARHWGTDEAVRKQWPEADDPRFVDWATRYLRGAGGPGAFRAIQQAWGADDVRHLLSAVQVPTLVVGRDFEGVPLAHAEYLAGSLPKGRLAVIPGTGGMLDVVRRLGPLVLEFIGVGGDDDLPPSNAAVLFTDIVDSTARAVALGDDAWDAILDVHDRNARATARSCGGRVVKSTGDGALCIFPDAAAAIAAARSLARMLQITTGVAMRAGVHVGEVIDRGDDVAGIAVHIAARVAAVADAGQVVVTDTPYAPVPESKGFGPAWDTELKGLPGRWTLRAGALIGADAPGTDVPFARVRNER